MGSPGSSRLLIALSVMFIKKLIFFTALVGILWSCDKDEDPAEPGRLELLQIFIGTTEINLSGTVTKGLPLDRSITLNFSQPLDQTSASTGIALKKAGQTVNTSVNLTSGGSTAVVFPAGKLESGVTYTIEVTDQLKSTAGVHTEARSVSFQTTIQDLEMISGTIGGKDASGEGNITDAPLDMAFVIKFSAPLNPTTLQGTIQLTGPNPPALQYNLSEDGYTLTVTTTAPLRDLSLYQVSLTNAVKGIHDEPFSGFTKTFYTELDQTPDFPIISDEELLTKVQQQTFNYFWDFAHPASGMARERNTSGDLITSGGTGFGIMALIVGMERHFITRQQGLERIDKILDFLETAQRFHGAWPHWIDGNTGEVIPFSTNDDGGDLVETSFLIQGLIAFRQYLDAGVAAEQALINRINTLWQTVEWDWYRRENQNVLYWHWSADVGWAMNHAVRGWNECLITYVLAASSTTHSIPAEVYTQGWAGNGGIQNGRTYENVVLPLGGDYGGPLFFTHYSFMGFDPRNLQDAYANYWTQNVNHTTINYKYCIRNPKNFVAYNDKCWGLTASDNAAGYSAHSPTNDLGVITPTAALSAFPYTPEESMKAMKFFYYTLGDRLWGDYGFYDAFNITQGWTANSYLAIDQGPVVVMIENYRTGLLWDLFMSAPEIQTGMTKLGFTN
jgi:hypothetical protein